MLSQGVPRDAAVKFSVASRGIHCSSNAFELNNSINHGETKGVQYNLFVAFKFII